MEINIDDLVCHINVKGKPTPICELGRGEMKL